MIFDEVFKNSESFRSWWRDPKGSLFRKALFEYHNSSYKELRSAEELVKVGRAQGKVEALSRIVNIEDELSQYLKRKTG